jgi:hypothetical protein
MSFDLFVANFRDGQNSAADAAAARAVLERQQCDHQPQSDSYYINFDDGSQVALHASGLDGGDKPFDGGMFVLHDFCEAVITFIFEFSRAAGCVIFPPIESNSVLIPCDDLAAHLPDDVTDEYQQIPIGSGAELITVLSGGYEAWQAYRNHVLQKPDARPEGTSWPRDIVEYAAEIMPLESRDPVSAPDFRELD